MQADRAALCPPVSRVKIDWNGLRHGMRWDGGGGGGGMVVEGREER